VPEVELEMRFASETSMVAVSRRRLVEVAERLGCGAIDAVAIIVSELVANAVEHGRGPVTLRAVHRRGRLRIEVHDRGPGAPEVRTAAPDAERGRGMYIVANLAVGWGVETGTTGKTVWAECRC